MAGATIPVVAVAAERRNQEQAALLERYGLEVMLFPLLRTEGGEADLLRAATGQLVAAPPDFFIANTGYGMRTWFELAAKWGLLDRLTASLSGHTFIAARGAKALGELRRAGLDAAYKAAGETLGEVAERLLAEGVAGKSVAVQAHGENELRATTTGAEEPANEHSDIVSRLREAGGEVHCVHVYRMEPAGKEVANGLVDATVSGKVAAVVFTASPQLQVLFMAAAGAGKRQELLAAFNERGTVAACIGEVCAGAARAEGIATPFVPEHPRLGSLIRGLASHLGTTGPGLADS